MSSFAELLESVSRGFLKNVLTGAGLTLATTGTILITINKLIDTMRDNITHLPPTAVALADSSGFDVYISFVLGAIMTKYVINSQGLILIQKKD